MLFFSVPGLPLALERRQTTLFDSIVKGANMRHFSLILTVSLFVLGCKHPRKFPPRPTMPIMKVARVQSDIVYTSMLEVEPDQFPSILDGFRAEVLSENGEECAASRFGACAFGIINSDEVVIAVYGITAAGEQTNICDQSQLAFELAHRSVVDGTEDLFSRVLTKNVEVRRANGQCVFALTDPPAMYSSLK